MAQILLGQSVIGDSFIQCTRRFVKFSVLLQELLPVVALDDLSRLLFDEVQDLQPVLRVGNVEVDGDEGFNDVLGGQVFDQGTLADFDQILKIFVKMA